MAIQRPRYQIGKNLRKRKNVRAAMILAFVGVVALDFSHSSPLTGQPNS